MSAPAPRDRRLVRWIAVGVVTALLALRRLRERWRKPSERLPWCASWMEEQQPDFMKRPLEWRPRR